jgi:hypothetical protein
VPFLSRTLLVASRRKEPNEATPPRKVDGPAGELSAASCATGGRVSGAEPGVSGSPRSNSRSAASLVSTRCFTETSRTTRIVIVLSSRPSSPFQGIRRLARSLRPSSTIFGTRGPGHMARTTMAATTPSHRVALTSAGGAPLRQSSARAHSPFGTGKCPASSTRLMRTRWRRTSFANASRMTLRAGKGKIELPCDAFLE